MVAVAVGDQDDVDVVKRCLRCHHSREGRLVRDVGVIDRPIVEDSVDQDLRVADLDQEALVGDVLDSCWRALGRSTT